MTDSKDTACTICGGNDADRPCAYPETDNQLCLRRQRLKDTKNHECDYCDGEGEIETDNNGPIVTCPVCGPENNTGGMPDIRYVDKLNRKLTAAWAWDHSVYDHEDKYYSESHLQQRIAEVRKEKEMEVDEIKPCILCKNRVYSWQDGPCNTCGEGGGLTPNFELDTDIPAIKDGIAEARDKELEANEEFLEDPIMDLMTAMGREVDEFDNDSAPLHIFRNAIVEFAEALRPLKIKYDHEDGSYSMGIAEEVAKAMKATYVAAYDRGHNDTVESQYTDPDYIWECEGEDILKDLYFDAILTPEDSE